MTRRRGFTLLEVMVALAILAGALLAVSEIVSSALRNHVRARNLEVATLLARGKMAALEDRFEAEGFRGFDENEDGTFEEEGHPEIRWELAIAVPTVELGPDQVLRALTGMGLDDIVPSPDEAPHLAPFQALLKVPLQPVLARMGETLKQGAREVRLTVSWPEGAHDESFTVTTHMVVLTGHEGGGK